jgi:cation:H+ antiporter
LPELLTAINSIREGAPSLSGGDFFGSSMFNMLMLAILDLLHQQKRMLRQVAMQHALTAGLAILLTGVAIFSLLADIDLRIGWVGVDSLLLIAIYLYGMGLINRNGRHLGGGEPEEEDLPEATPSLRTALIGFGLATVVLLIVTPFLVRSSVGIAEITGLGVGFVGAALVAIVTSLPEAVTTIAAARMGAYNLAVGNLFGSNAFNMFALGIADLFYLDGRFLSVIDPALALAGLMGLLLTCMALIGNLAREERRLVFIEIDALVIFVGYFAGMWVLYHQGIL